MFGGRKRGPVDNEKYYKVLGVGKEANSGELKKAYYKLAKDLHPDKNQGDPDKLAQVLINFKLKSTKYLSNFFTLFFFKNK